MRKLMLAALTAVTLFLAGCAISFNPAKYPFENFASKAQEMSVKVITNVGTGSGVWVSPTMILTAKHVLTLFGPAERIQVLLPDGQLYDAKVHAVSEGGNADFSHDWAVLEVEGYESPMYASAQCTQPQVGESVLGAGYPLSKGYVPFLGEIISSDWSTAEWAGAEEIWEHGYLSTLMIGPGASGGAVYNTSGELIGTMVGVLTAGGQFGQIIYPVKNTPLCQGEVHESERIWIDDPDMDDPTWVINRTS